MYSVSIWQAVASYRDDPDHLGISALDYAGPGPRGAVVDHLDAVILGAAEVDLEFNVNVTLGADGRIIGGSGGHADAAAGAKLTVITTRLRAGRHAKLVEKVGHVTTPGRDVDVVVTEAWGGGESGTRGAGGSAAACGAAGSGDRRSCAGGGAAAGDARGNRGPDRGGQRITGTGR